MNKMSFAAVTVVALGALTSSFSGHSVEEVNKIPNDYNLIREVVTKTGRPEAAIWKIAKFENGNIVELDLSVESRIIASSNDDDEDVVVYRYQPMKTLPADIGKLTTLRKLNLEGNRLKSLPEEIGQLTELKVLSVRNNYLRSVPESIANLEHLEVLDLRSNKLRVMHDGIGKLALLKQLHLSGNRIKVIPNSLMDLRLDQFSIDHNHLRGVNSDISQWVKANNDLYYN